MLNRHYFINIWGFVALYLAYALVSLVLFYLTGLPGFSVLVLLIFSAGYYSVLGFVILITIFVHWRSGKLTVACSPKLLLFMEMCQILTILSNISGGSFMSYYASCSPYQNFIQRILAPLPEGADCSNLPWIGWQGVLSFYFLYTISGLIFWLGAVFSSRTR